MLAYVRSDIGLVRETNEDSYAFSPPHLFVVADGMGGHAAGEIASSLAIKTIKEYVTQNINTVKPNAVLEQAITEANKIIYEMAYSNGQYAGMGTTVTAAYLDTENIFWAHVGDSRMYLLRDSEICQLTSDHSLVWELVESGKITPEEALFHPQRNLLTRAVGTSSNISVDTGIASWTAGNKLLLCTDGLTNMVSEAGICSFLRQSPLDNSIMDTLIEEAKKAGGLDNITAILVQNGD